MHRYFITLAYKGSNYHGWQKQKNSISVQQILEERISLKLREKIELTGAGRTDTGVHASFYVAHFDLNKKISEKQMLINSINSFLPNDIKIYDIKEVTSNAHARYSALSRTYHYFFTTLHTPFLNDYVWHINFLPDLNLLQEALNFLLGKHDFEAFSKKDKSAKTSVCNIFEAKVQRTYFGFYIKIKADRFLRNMVRAIVGTIYEIAKKELKANHIIKVLESKDRSQAASSAPAQGLFFTNVEYPDNIFLEEKITPIKNFLLL